MRRILLIGVVAFGCKKDQAKQAAPPPAEPTKPAAIAVTPADAAEVAVAPAAPGDAAPATVTAVGGMLELLHAARATVRVSSRVANKKILPAHLVDRSTSTAWNSRTGDLIGAWIDVTVPAGKISELRMTVGHTGKGPAGEDYFTMNPRIRKVTVVDGKTTLATATLDIERRDLQTIKLAAPSNHVRLRVDDVAPGAKPSWRETCMSELEAWGTLLPGNTAAPHTPQVEVGDPPDDAWATPPIKDPGEYCAKLMKPMRAAYDKAIAAINAENAHCDPASPMCGDPDPPGEPACEMAIDKPVTTGMWKGVGVMSSTTDVAYGPRPTQIVVESKDGYWPVGDEIDCGAFSEKGRCTLEITSASVKKTGELEISYTLHAGTGDSTGALVCAAQDNVSCTPP